MDYASATPKVIHPAWLRFTHWTNVVAVLVMVTSGWQIYNASPIFDFRFAKALTLGGWLGGALLWHFAAMWLLFLNGVLYLGLCVGTGRFKCQLLPLRPREVLADALAAVRGKLSHDNLAQYNAVQKLAYLFILADLALLVVSGLVIFKPVQFPILRTLLGDFDNARIVHFCAMTGLVAFVIVHVLMAALVPRTILAMVRGR
jgi:thiosulfate reductase cytochrome b subunit